MLLHDQKIVAKLFLFFLGKNPDQSILRKKIVIWKSLIAHMFYFLFQSQLWRNKAKHFVSIIHRVQHQSKKKLNIKLSELQDINVKNIKE